MPTPSTELVPVPTPSRLPTVATVDVVAAFLAGRTPQTLRAYAGDIEHFARFLGQSSGSIAVDLLLSLNQGDANAAALAYRADMTDRKLSPATIARRLAALRSVVKCARMLGRVGWTIDVESPRAERYRDTAGPGTAGWDRLWSAAVAAGDEAKARRDRAILRLLSDLGLRRGEAAALDLADVDLDADVPGVSIVGKGRTQSERLTLPAPTRRALAEWIAARGTEPGPLFVRLDPGAITRQRLTGESVRLLVAALSRAAGLTKTVRPHGLRHHAITRALDLTHGNVRDVAQFSRHKDIKTLMVYDDRRKDVGGAIACMIAGE